MNSIHGFFILLNMKKIISFPIKKIKSFVFSNKKLFLIIALVLALGICLGAFLVINDSIEGEIYTTSDISLSDIIMGETGFFGLFFKNLWTLFVPLIIIFVLFSNNYSYPLSFFYLAFQGLLFGVSVSTLVLDSAVAGILNIVFVVLPINLINFFVLSSWVVVCYKRLKVARLQKLSLVYTTRVFFGNFLFVIFGAIFSSVCYGLLYPLLLKSVVVVPLL